MLAAFIFSELIFSTASLLAVLAACRAARRAGGLWLRHPPQCCPSGSHIGFSSLSKSLVSSVPAPCWPQHVQAWLLAGYLELPAHGHLIHWPHSCCEHPQAPQLMQGYHSSASVSPESREDALTPLLPTVSGPLSSDSVWKRSCHTVCVCSAPRGSRSCLAPPSTVAP